MDTIFALSSGGLPAGIAVVRVSGPRAMDVVRRLTGAPLPTPRKLALRTLVDPQSGLVLDEALVCRMPGPDSFTGEDCVELHCHGSLATVQAVLDSLAKQKGLRPARAGEFTRRAFVNNRMDLTQVEGLADLIAAETEVQRRQALAVAEGSTARMLSEWRATLIGLLAQVEARLDFSDEDDVGELGADFGAGIAGLVREIRSMLAGSKAAEQIRGGLRVALFGRPNVGKSTLLNALAGRDVAIVHEEPGTTRDVLDVRLDLGGYPVRLFDTAGMRAGGGPVEQEGMRRAERIAEASDLILVLSDGPPGQEAEAEGAPAWADGETWTVWTKADLGGAQQKTDSGRNQFLVSAVSGQGMTALVEALGAHAARTMNTGGTAVVARARQREALQSCLEEIVAAGGSAIALEVVAEHLRGAVQRIGELSGKVDVEDVLDKLFDEFCIGK